MSDRVVIVSGSTSGRDHFPVYAPVTDLPGGTSTGDGTFYPFVVDAAQMCRWFYVVKKWNVRFDYTWHDSFLTSYTSYASFDYQDQINDGSVWRLATRESDWAIYTAGSAFAGVSIETGGTDFTYPDTQPVDGESIVDNFLTDAPGDDNLFLVYLNFYTPRWNDGLTCYCEIHGGAGDQEFGSAGFGLREIGTVDLDNGAVTFPTYAIDDGVGDNPLDVLNVTIKPVAFWPYKLRNGNPVWDATTGAQLNDPLADFDVGQTDEEITQGVGASPGVPSTLVVQRNPSPWIVV